MCPELSSVTGTPLAGCLGPFTPSPTTPNAFASLPLPPFLFTQGDIEADSETVFELAAHVLQVRAAPACLCVSVCVLSTGSPLVSGLPSTDPLLSSPSTPDLAACPFDKPVCVCVAPTLYILNNCCQSPLQLCSSRVLHTHTHTRKSTIYLPALYLTATPAWKFYHFSVFFFLKVLPRS